jgi:hypothetical protein
LTQNGQRHRLVLYTYVINRLRRLTFFIGSLLIGLAATLAWLPSILPEFVPISIDETMIWTLGDMGFFAICLTIFLTAVRKSAYVQPFDTYLRLVTPFLAMNISYRRFIQATSTELGRIFFIENLNGWKREYLQPLSGLTAIVIELDGWPLPRRILELFLSPYFFPDRTARLALVVSDWMKFSNELECKRSRWADSLRKQADKSNYDLFANPSRKK